MALEHTCTSSTRIRVGGTRYSYVCWYVPGRIPSAFRAGTARKHVRVVCSVTRGPSTPGQYALHVTHPRYEKNTHVGAVSNIAYCTKYLWYENSLVFEWKFVEAAYDYERARITYMICVPTIYQYHASMEVLYLVHGSFHEIVDIGSFHELPRKYMGSSMEVHKNFHGSTAAVHQ